MDAMLDTRSFGVTAYTASMGIFKKIAAAFKEANAPKLYQGELIEQKLYPLEGFQDERTDAADARNRRIVWVEFNTDTVKSGKFKGSTLVRVIDRETREEIGNLPVRYIEKNEPLLAAMNSGINAATCFLEMEQNGSDIYSATLRLGEHRFMPNPYWK